MPGRYPKRLEALMADFNKVGLLITKENTFLVCRKNNYTSKLIMPGGQIEPGETDEDCLKREIREELGDVILDHIQLFGTYEDKAASDDPTVNKTVQIRLYSAEMKGTPIASDEIIELIWFDPNSDHNDLSPIIANKILPDLIAREKLKKKTTTPTVKDSTRAIR
jgi:8-oxo-dGTP diphosphatase